MSKTINEQAIINRHSVRTYQTTPITTYHQQELLNFIDHLENPWNIKIKIAFINDLKDTDKIGTYGMIKDPAFFITALANDQPYAQEAIGYTLEHIVLFAESLGISSCWLGATYTKDHVQKILNIKKYEIMPVIIAMGYAKEKIALKDRIIKKVISSYDRLPFEQLFFENDPKTPLPLEKCGQYQKCLNMVRLAPSAFNIQPWRIIKANDAFHFYIYSAKELKVSSLKHVDLGIALAHFVITANILNLSGYLEIKADQAYVTYDHYHYIISWQIK